MTSKNTSPGEEKTERRGMPPRVAPSKPESSPNPPARTPTEASRLRVRQPRNLDRAGFIGMRIYETAVSGSNKRNLEEQLRVLVAVMGSPPDKRKFPWRSTVKILSDISGDMPDGYDRRLRRLLYEYPSRFVHIRARGGPTPDSVVGGARSSLLLAITLAMKLCRDEQLVPTDLSRETDEIITMCEKLRGIEVMDNEL